MFYAPLFPFLLRRDLHHTPSRSSKTGLQSLPNSLQRWCSCFLAHLPLKTDLYPIPPSEGAAYIFYLCIRWWLYSSPHHNPSCILSAIPSMTPFIIPPKMDFILSPVFQRQGLRPPQRRRGFYII